MMTFLKRVLIGLVCFSPAFLTAYLCPVVKNFDLTLTGWGWGVLIGFTVVGWFINGYIAGFTKGFLGEERKALAFAIEDALQWVFFALAFIATCAVVPALASYTSLAGGLTFVGVIAVCSGVDEYVLRRLDLR